MTARSSALPQRPRHPASPLAIAKLPETDLVRWFKPDEDLEGELVLSGATELALEQLARELRHTDDFLRAGVDPPTRLLFSGPSGVGKTLAVRWLGWSFKLPVALIDVSEVVGSHLGETSNNIGAAFKVASEAPSILFFDEVDAICLKRGGKEAYAAELSRATTVFLQQIDWLRPGRIVIAATNFADALDGALRRRLTTEIVFEMPDRRARERMLARWLARAPLAGAIIQELLDASDGKSGADLRSMAMARARREMSSRMPSSPPPLLPAVPKKQTEHAQELLKNLDALGEQLR